MIGAVVIGTVSEGYGKAIGVVVGHHQVVAPGLAGRIGGTGIVGCVLGKVARVAKAPVDFIGGDMMKEHRGSRKGAIALLPVQPGHVQEGISAEDIGGYKGFGPPNGPVHMTFGGKVDNCINLVFPNDPFHGRAVPDIGLYKDIAGIGAAAKTFSNIRKALGVPRIGQGIHIDDPARKARLFRKKVADHIGTDKAGPAGDKNICKCAHWGSPVFIFLLLSLALYVSTTVMSRSS